MQSILQTLIVYEGSIVVYRLANDVEGMLDHAQSLIRMLKQSEIDLSRILLKFPGTSAGIQTASR